MLDNVQGKLPRSQWEERYKVLYKNKEKGAITEKTFEDLMGADAIQLEIQIGKSKRYLDNVKNGIAREIKSGRVTWSSYKSQVMKDLEIVVAGIKNINKVEWHCFGEVDAKFIQNVKAEVKKAGLKDTEFIIIQY